MNTSTAPITMNQEDGTTEEKSSTPTTIGDKEFHEDSFWADFTYDWDGKDPFQEYDDQSPEWD